MKFTTTKMYGLAAMLGMSFAVSQAHAAICAYKVDSQWDSGFTATITITNDNSAVVNGWNLGWQYSANRITNSWNATMTGSNPYSAVPLDWNKTIQPGQSVSFGFQGTKNNTNAAETPVITGVVCSAAGSSASVSSVKSSAVSSSKSSSSFGINCSEGNNAACSSKSNASLASSASSSVISGAGFVSQHGRLKTVNGRLVDKNGSPTPLHGMSTHGLQWFGKFYNQDTIRWLRDDWHANVIRAAMYTKEGGYLDNPSVLTKVWETVDAAIAADIYVIVDWHILSDGNPLTNKEAAKDFFRQVTAKYGNDAHIIYEIANEPNGADVSWGSAIKPYANEVIPVIRAGAPDAFVIVGTAVWSQRLDQVVADPLAFSNVAYTVHFYACSVEHQDSLRALVKSAADAKLPIFSTEWGDAEYTGNGATCPAQVDIWMNLLDQYGISWVNWNLSDAPETSAALKSGASTTGGWSASQLTESGNYVRNRMRSYTNGNSSSVGSSAQSSSSLSCPPGNTWPDCPHSSSVASVASSSALSSSSSSIAATQQCNWYGQLVSLCTTTTSGWGWENNLSCVAVSTCSGQPAPYGVVGGASSVSSIASSIASTSVKSNLSSLGVQSSSTKSSIVSSAGQSSSGQSSLPPGVRMDNPFIGAVWYVDPIWSAKAGAETNGSKVAKYNTAVWMDRIGAIVPTDGSYGLRDHLNAALAQKANVIQVVVYDLPNRDCHALSSNGELKQGAEGTARYRTEYIDALAAIFADAKYKDIRIIAIIEPDSLPNLVTNLDDPDCALATDATHGYIANTRYTLNKFYPITNVYSYMDAGHSGWLGWDENLGKATTLVADTVKGTTNGVNSVAGFVTNTAGVTPLSEPFLDAFEMASMPGSNGGTQVRQAKFYQWNTHFGEISFAKAWRTKMIAAGFPATIGMLIDTARNGWGGANRPSVLSSSTLLETFVDDSRIDRRSHRGNWCNQKSGIGERPQVVNAEGIDAYVWVKPPGESDGAASKELSFDPQDPAKGFDEMCSPTYLRSESSGTVDTGAIANAPVAGRWFPAGFKILLDNAYPALQ